jgi:hypothetical protein
MPEPFSIIGLLAIGKAAITTWVAEEGADFVKDKVTGFAKDKSKEFCKNQLTQFRENAKLHLLIVAVLYENSPLQRGGIRHRQIPLRISRSSVSLLYQTFVSEDIW